MRYADGTTFFGSCPCVVAKLKGTSAETGRAEANRNVSASVERINGDMVNSPADIEILAFKNQFIAGIIECNCSSTIVAACMRPHFVARRLRLIIHHFGRETRTEHLDLAGLLESLDDIRRQLARPITLRAFLEN